MTPQPNPTVERLMEKVVHYAVSQGPQARGHYDSLRTTLAAMVEATERAREVVSIAAMCELEMLGDSLDSAVDRLDTALTALHNTQPPTRGEDGDEK